MGLFLSTAASLMLTYSGVYGIEFLLARYATPEARALLQKEPELSPGTLPSAMRQEGTRQA